MEEGGRSHFVLEVDDLNHRILNLRDTVTSLFEVISKRRSEATTALQLVQDSVQVIQEVAADTAMVAVADSAAAAGQFTITEDMVDQLTALRGQLLRLSQAEARLAAAAAIPGQSTVAAMAPITALVPYNSSSSSSSSSRYILHKVAKIQSFC